MDIKDDVNSAGDVEVLNAMFEFPMPPTVESVLRIAADGSRIRISADGSIYPVPPAGDAEESVADVVMFEGGKIIDGTLAYMETAVVGDRLYSTAYVTRLAAERDGANTALDTYLKLLNEVIAERDGVRQTIHVIDHHLRGHVNDPDPLVSNSLSEGSATTYGLVAGLKRERDRMQRDLDLAADTIKNSVMVKDYEALQSELTKALELLKRLEPNDMPDKQFQEDCEAVLAHQSAPAGKGE